MLPLGCAISVFVGWLLSKLAEKQAEVQNRDKQLVTILWEEWRSVLNFSGNVEDAPDALSWYL